jgi:hypothetical protein
MDGKRVVSWSSNTFEICDLPGLKKLARVHADRISCCLFSPAQNRLAVIAGKTVEIYDLDRDNAPISLSHLRNVGYAQFSPNGALLVSCCSDPVLTKCYAQMWDVATGRPVGPQLKHGDGVLSAVFSRDGHRVVTAAEDFTSVVWDVPSGKALTPGLEHDNPIRKAIFSNDRKRVATASADKSARIWDAETGLPLTPAIHFPAELTDIHLCEHGQTMLVTDDKGQNWRWKLPTEERARRDVLQIANLLSAKTLNAPDQLRASARPHFDTEWADLKQQYPGQFVVTDDDVTAWHETRAKCSEVERQWTTAVFHLKHLLAAKPNDPEVMSRLALAEAHLRN